MTRVRSAVRVIISAAALAAILGGVPALLVRFGHWPRLGPPTSDWWTHLPDSAVSDSTVFTVLTIAAGLVWALFALSVFVEAVAGLGGRQAPRLVLAGALQRPAQALVVSLLMTLSINRGPAFAGPAMGSAPATPRAPVAVAVLPTSESASPAPVPASPDPGIPGSGPVAPNPPASPAQPAGGPVVVVERGDSAWRLATEHLGDGMRWRELWDLNRGVAQPDGRAWTDPQLIRPGWQLRLPAADPAATNTAVAAGGLVHVVAPGDTLSQIAARYLGDPARYRELFDANHDRPQADGQRLTDPNLIRPGWHLLIPAPTTQTNQAPDPSALPESAAAAPAPVPLPPAPHDRTIPAATPLGPPISSPSVTAPTPEPRASTAMTPPMAAPPTPAALARSSTATDHTTHAGRAPLLAGISGAVVLATGIALRAVRLRRRRQVRGARHTRLAATATETAVIAAADVPLVRWAGQALADLVGGLDRRRITAAPLAIELSSDAGLEVLWDNPQTTPPPPGWTSADGGWAWRHAFDPDAPVPVDELPAAIPALVTIGRRDDRQLLVDLEAFGALTVTGPAEQVDAFLRSLAVELATGDDLSDAYLSTVGIDTGLADQTGRASAVAFEDALATVDRACRATRDDLDRAGLVDTFRARAGEATPLEATVVVAAGLDRGRVGELVAAASPRCGVGVVAGCDAADTANAAVVLDVDGTGRLEPFGITFDAAGLPAATADRLAETLTALAQLPADDPADDDPEWQATAAGLGPSESSGQPDLGMDSRIRAGLNGNGTYHPAGADSGPRVPMALPDLGAEPANGALESPGGGGQLFDLDPEATSATAPAAMVVRVLGVPSVPDRPDLGRRELILAVLLACRGGSLAATAVQDAVWGGKPVEAKTVWNFVASTRRGLGAFGDGSPVMPAADRSRGRLRLDPRVTTDLAVLADRLERARTASSSEAIGLLCDGLALVEGPPFDAAGFDWAHRDQDVAQASMVIEQAVEMLVGLALEAGFVDVARDGVTRGLRGLPGDEQLYRARMRVEHHAGQHTAVAAAYDELTVYLADFDLEPSPATTALYHDLVRRQRV